MKKVIQHISVIMIALVILFTGMGATVLNVCCMNCVSSLLVNNSQACCVTGMPEKELCCLNTDSVCEVLSEDGVCSISRISQDLDASFFKPLLFVPFAWIFDFISSTDSLDKVEFRYSVSEVSDNSPPIVPPRTYLSMLRVLII